MILIPLLLGVAAYGAVTTYTADDDDGLSWPVQMALLGIVFVAVWGAAAYFLQRAGFFAELGKAARGLLEALGISDLIGTLSSAVKAVL